MKSILASILLATTLLAQIEWQENFSTALHIAKKEQKPLFVFMQRTNPPCRWCEKMKKFTLSNNEIAKMINRNFVAVKIDKYEDTYPSTLSSQYVPAIFIVDPQTKKVLYKIVGFWGVQDFKSDLNDIFKILHKQTKH